ncbi:MAG: MFS transporter [Steroidobacteraceae bacterium]
MTTREQTSAFQRWRSTTLAPFQHRAFALFWWASLVSSLGSLIQTVGASWLMATISPSADQVALVQTAGALPFFFLSLLAGAYVDTHDRRSLMLLATVVMLLASGVLAAITLSGHVTPAVLLGLTFTIGCGSAAFTPAWQASISDQVPRALVPSAIMANAVGFNLARSVGPAVGGVIVAAAGVAVSFVINAVSYIGLLGVLAWWRPARSRSALPPEPLGAAVAAGIRYFRLSPHLLAIIARAVLYAVPMSAILALMPVVARDLLGGGALTYGLLLGAFGVGAMLGALSSAALRSRYSSESLLRVMSALACVALMTIAQSRWAPLTLLATLLAGSVWTLGLATYNIAVQMSSPRWVMGRMVATYQTLAFAGIAIGAGCWGALASRVGLRESLTAAGAMTLVSLALARRLPVSIAQLGSLDPATATEIRPPQSAIQPLQGPIVITVEYRVPSGNVPQFLEAIHEMGRIRRRDGAREWSICQDIDETELWIERFEAPTWVDHLRRHARLTLADQAARERIKQLILGEQGRVRRLIERPPGAEPLGADYERPEAVDGIPPRM